MNKVGTVFHEDFALRRSSLSQILKLSLQADGTSTTPLTPEYTHRETTLGTNEAKSMLRYAQAVGFLDEQYLITKYGKFVYLNDYGLNKEATLWTMHYHLVAPHWAGPAFWYHLFKTVMVTGNEFRTDSVAEELDRHILDHQAKKIAASTSRSTATVFLGTYHKSDALGALNLLSSIGKDEFAVNEAESCSTHVFAYVLADYWQSVWGDSTTVSLREVTAEGGPASLLLLGSGEANQLLMEMQEAGIVEVLRRVPPYQVVRLWNADNLMEKLYA